DIILNLKQIRLKKMIEEEESETATVTVSGKQEFTAEDISKCLSSFKVLNPGLHICTMEPNVKIVMHLTINKGRGYVPSDENKVENAPVDTIPIDSIFTPIRNVNFWREDWRVEQKTDYECLKLEITTDGSIHPKDALKEASKILIQHFMLFSDEKITLESPVEEQKNGGLDEESLRMRHLLLTKLSDMELSVRALNCLKAANIDTFADLVSHQRSELMKFRNFGKKSLNEIDMLVDRLKLTFGMDINKYNIEKNKRTAIDYEA
ncbi:MAG: DNA-directed RNA polymerase subunit alpha, partial [Bacteroidales bacterium]|nr:DNA-directed RNA polymerase subunit alpha [Bacteroidales bacterium]